MIDYLLIDTIIRYTAYTKGPMDNENELMTKVRKDDNYQNGFD